MRAGMLSRGKVDPETVREVIESSLMEGARASGKRWITAVGPGKERMELSGIGDVATAAVVNVAVDMMRGQNELPDDIREAVDESPETDDGDLDMKVSRLTGRRSSLSFGHPPASRSCRQILRSRLSIRLVSADAFLLAGPRLAASRLVSPL